MLFIFHILYFLLHISILYFIYSSYFVLLLNSNYINIEEKQKMQRLVIPFRTLDDKQKCLEINVKSSVLKKRQVKTWTVQEDEKLVSLYNQHPKKWNIISEKMKSRNQNQCLHRFRRICQLGQNRKIWSPQEDEVVLKTMDEVGPNWKLIAHVLGTKTGKQIRQRFINKLDPSIRRQQWTQQQDMQIIQLYTQLGSKWCQISKCLPGRPENKIKNRFYSYIQKNYEFQVKENMTPENGLQNKENSFMATAVKVIQKRQSENTTSDRKTCTAFTGFRILEQKMQNRQELKFQTSVKQHVKQEYLKSQIVEEQNQNNYNSLKQINEECFFKSNQNVSNNDLLYFQDN